MKLSSKPVGGISPEASTIGCRGPCGLLFAPYSLLLGLTSLILIALTAVAPGFAQRTPVNIARPDSINIPTKPGRIVGVPPCTRINPLLDIGSRAAQNIGSQATQNPGNGKISTSSASALRKPAEVSRVDIHGAIHDAIQNGQPPQNTFQSFTSGSQSAGVIQTFRISRVQDLDFGVVVVGPGGGSITTNPTGPPSYSGAITPDPEISPNAGQYLLVPTRVNTRAGTNAMRREVRLQSTSMSGADALMIQTQRSPETAAPNNAEIFSLVSLNDVLLVSETGTETMRVDNFRIVCEGGQLRLGATLHINPRQAAGIYSGQFPITIISE